MKTILSAFDIRKLRARCNFPGCQKRPVSELTISQRSHRKGEKALASIYVCKCHIRDAERLAESIGSFSRDMIIECRKRDMKKGTVAQTGRAHG